MDAKRRHDLLRATETKKKSLSQPATTLATAIDISNWQGEIGPDNLRTWQVTGVKRVIVRASAENEGLIAVAKQQMRAVIDGGMTLHAYVWLYFNPLGEPPDSQMETALEIYNDIPIWQWWLDCEEESPFSTEDTVAWIQQALGALPAGKRGLYSSAGWINQYAGGGAAFASEPFWVASWGGSEPTMPRGLTQWAMWQTAANIPLGGKQVDLNVYRV